MELSTIMSIVTILVTFVLGLISKKSSFVKNEIIPLQNLLVGIISATIYYIITKDFNLVIATIGLFTGGTYDILNNLNKLLNVNNQDEQ